MSGRFCWVDLHLACRKGLYGRIQWRVVGGERLA